MNTGQQSLDVRVGSWILNICLGVVLLAAWAIDHSPLFGVAAAWALLTAALIGVGTLALVKLREARRLKAQVASAAKSAARDSAIEPMDQRGGPAIVQLPVERTVYPGDLRAFEQYITSSRKALLAVNHYAVIRALMARQLKADQVEIIRRHDAAVRVLRARSVSYGAEFREDSRHFVLDPQSEDYTITIGMVKIVVVGGETRVTVGSSSASASGPKIGRSEPIFQDDTSGSISKTLH